MVRLAVLLVCCLYSSALAMSPDELTGATGKGTVNTIKTPPLHSRGQLSVIWWKCLSKTDPPACRKRTHPLVAFQPNRRLKGTHLDSKFTGRGCPFLAKCDVALVSGLLSDYRVAAG